MSIESRQETPVALGATEDDANFQELVKTIKESHKNSQDDALQQLALQKSMEYIHENYEIKHLFCDKAMYHPCVHALILFSFPDNEALTWYKERIAHSLDTCSKCITLFHRGRAKLKLTFAIERGIDASSVQQFTAIVLNWEAERLLRRLETEWSEFKMARDSNPDKQVPRCILMGVAECLSGPGMLRQNNELLVLFNRILYFLLSIDHKFVQMSTTITPGYLYLMFDGEQAQRHWALKRVESLYNPASELRLATVSSDILEEFSIHFLNIQSPSFFNDENCGLFYRNMLLLLQLYDVNVILEKFALPQDIESVQKVLNYEIIPLLKLLQKHLMSYFIQPLPYILRFFNLILTKFGEKFWNHTSSYSFHNFIETITGSPSFASSLAQIPPEKTPNEDINSKDSKANDMLNWIDHFIASLVSSKEQQALNRLSLNLISHMESNNGISLDNRALLFDKACKLISKALSITSSLYSDQFATDILMRSDSRVVVDEKLVRFIDYATCKAIFFPPSEKLKNADISKSATEVLCRALRFDLLSFSRNSYDIHNGKETSTLKFSPALFKALLQQNLAVQLELAYQLLSSMENVSGIIPLGSHKTEVEAFLGYLQQFFVLFSDIDTKNTKMILSNPKSLSGYWACVFSSNSDLYQSAVDILYETFDVEGRLEGIHGLLLNNLDACIRAINSNLTNLIFIRFYEPCPRAVRVLSDVIHALNNKIDGIFNDTSRFSDSEKEVLVHFWNRCWKFLELIYVETLQWANKYSEHELIEFTRDTLDLSQALVDCFMTINMISANQNAKQTMFEVTNTFPHMLVWLRLSDPGLLASCVKLISSTVDLAMEMDLKLDPNVLVLLAKYGSKAKKFNNKLTDQQSSEIIQKAKQFDKNLVEKTIEEAEKVKKSKAQQEEGRSSNVSSRDSTPTTGRSSPSTLSLSSSTAPRRGQLKITNFGSLSKVAPAAPAKPQLPMSALEKARNEMREKTPRVIHEARPSGFNVKPTKPSHKDESSDEESDTEDARSLFNLPSEKKQSITILDGPKSLSRPRRTIMEERKREEEYSRKRLNVDMRPLYQKVLQWSFQNESEYPDGVETKYPVVAGKFTSADDYIRVYEPLLLLECWQAILGAKKKEENKPFPIDIASKTTVDNFFEVFFHFPKSELMEKGLNESDLVVLALTNGSTKDLRCSDIQNSKLTCLAKVKEIKHLKGDHVDVALRVTRSAALNNVLTPKSPIVLMKVMQMTTLEREYSSLHGLRYYNLSKQILQALPDTTTSSTNEEIQEIQKNYKVNNSQAMAISSSTKSKGFFLIQGPPGTGKTKTILGIIGHMLSSFRSQNAIETPGVQKSDVSAFKNKKVLICAPSNAAVDELVLRLKDGVFNSKGEQYKPKLVRLGRTDAINTAVKDMTLEELVDAQLGKNSVPKSDELTGLFKELTTVKQEINRCRSILADDKTRSDEKARTDLRTHKLKANAIKAKMDQAREVQNTAYRDREINRRNIQARILNEAEIICSTLSGAAHDMVANIGIKFDSVVIDEACQCTELSTIIPLRYGCQRCIMVGDPNQLPPTVLSSVAAESKYDQSLFVRMANNSKPLLLDVQYRMHSEISKFPSKKFYDGHLKDGPSMDELTKREWHQDRSFPPYKFFDIIEGQESQNSKTFSYVNRMEISIAIELISTLFKRYPRLNFTNKIGVITPYKEQNRDLQKAFIREFGQAIKKEVSFNTIDGFQGQEKEIIIMSCVRADSNKSGVGFLKDFRRMNVALTRSKSSLWILGNHNSLIKNDLWKDLIIDAKERKVFETVVRGFTSNTTRPNRPQLTKKVEKHVPKPNIQDVSAAEIAAMEPVSVTKPSNIPQKPIMDQSSSRDLETPVVSRPHNSGTLPSQPIKKKDSVFGAKPKAGAQAQRDRPKTSGAQGYHRKVPDQGNSSNGYNYNQSISLPSSSSGQEGYRSNFSSSSENSGTNNNNNNNNNKNNNNDCGSSSLPRPSSTNNVLPRAPNGPKRPHSNVFVQTRKRRHR